MPEYLVAKGAYPESAAEYLNVGRKTSRLLRITFIPKGKTFIALSKTSLERSDTFVDPVQSAALWAEMPCGSFGFVRELRKVTLRSKRTS